MKPLSDAQMILTIRDSYTEEDIKKELLSLQKQRFVTLDNSKRETIDHSIRLFEKALKGR